MPRLHDASEPSRQAFELLKKHLLDRKTGLGMEHLVALNLRWALLPEGGEVTIREAELVTIHLALHLAACLLAAQGDCGQITLGQ